MLHVLQGVLVGSGRAGVAGVVLGALVLGSGCTSESVLTGDPTVVVNTETERARAQYDANVSFVEGYTPACSVDPSDDRARLPRALISGFGRFLSVKDNATGRIVERLGVGIEYPLTDPPPNEAIDPPEPQTRVAMGVLQTEDAGDVLVCAMVLPVYWDVAAALIAKESSVFRPDFVMMNGVAGKRQPLWLELGAINRAMEKIDGSARLEPVSGPDGERVVLVDEASEDEQTMGLRLSWARVRDAATAEAERLHDIDRGDGVLFGEVLAGAKLAGYPRSSNTYLCNNTAYVVNYLFQHPYRSARLLVASHPSPEKPNSVRVRISAWRPTIPRVFVHWPSELARSDAHLDAAARVMARIIGTQMEALESDPPTEGDNALAEIASSGETY